MKKSTTSTAFVRAIAMATGISHFPRCRKETRNVVPVSTSSATKTMQVAARADVVLVLAVLRVGVRVRVGHGHLAR